MANEFSTQQHFRAARDNTTRNPLASPFIALTSVARITTTDCINICIGEVTVELAYERGFRQQSVEIVITTVIN